jgi:hypothetical protein
MSNVAKAKEAEAEHNMCANCGTAGGDNSLKKCAGCELVRYCNVNCQREHRPRHKKACKKRVKELHDKQLFTQPDGSHLGECHICFLPLPIDNSSSLFHPCCSETICKGCAYAKMIMNIHDEMKAFRCPFCRESVNNREQYRKRHKERIKANDPAAMKEMGVKLYNEGDYNGALQYYTKAAELGDLIAHYQLARMYHEGEGVEKNMKKAVRHLEKAAIGGHPYARHNLACIEVDNGNIERAVKHFIIAANLGYEKSMKELWKYYSAGNITKEDLDATLRTHQVAIEETKSEQRDAADLALKDYV